MLGQGKQQQQQQQRVIMLADCQSFYASVEKAAHPQYAHQPLVVAGDPARRSGIVLAACPLAKQHGITTAERLGEALAKCPQLVVIRPRMQAYIDVSMQITEIFQSYTDLVEPYSIDEQFLDVTGSRQLFGEPAAIAAALQARVLAETGVYVRFGISANKVVAKMACDNFAKRNSSGIFELPLSALEQTLWPLPVRAMFMIGARMTRHLNRMGIATIGELARTPLAQLRRRWGVNGEVVWRIANGYDDAPVNPGTHGLRQKAIGHQMTLPRDYRSWDEIRVPLLELSELVCQRTRAKGCMGWVVSTGCQGADYDRPAGFHRQMKLAEPTNLTREVYEAAAELFRRHWDGLPIRRIGVALGELSSDQEYQLSLFANREKQMALERAADQIKARYGNTALMRAASLQEAGQTRDRAAKIGGHYK